VRQWRCNSIKNTKSNALHLAIYGHISQQIKLTNLNINRVSKCNCLPNLPTLLQHVRCCTDFYLKAIHHNLH